MAESIQEKIDYILNMQNIISKVCSDEELLFEAINKLKDNQNYLEKIAEELYQEYPKSNKNNTTKNTGTQKFLQMTVVQMLLKGENVDNNTIEEIKGSYVNNKKFFNDYFNEKKYNTILQDMYNYSKSNPFANWKNFANILRRLLYLKEDFNKVNEYLKDISSNIISDCEFDNESLKQKTDGFLGNQGYGRDVPVIVFHDKKFKNQKEAIQICLHFQNNVIDTYIQSGKEDNYSLNESISNTSQYQQLIEDIKNSKEDFIKKTNNRLDNKNDSSDKQQIGEDKSMHKNIPLNQILYGPPGTGKTYNTIVKAVDIIGYEYLFKKWFLQTSKAKNKDGTLKQYLSCIHKFKENVGINIFLCKEKDIYENMKTCIENTQYFKDNCLHADSSPGLSHYQQALLHYKSFLNDTNFSYEEIKECFDYYKTIEHPLIEFITFHQSYSYEEFVEGIKPYIKNDIWSKKKELIDLEAETLPDIKYIGQKGIFKNICDRAKNDKDNKYVLLIDEINRGNISKIFGELITLIEEDKRKKVYEDGKEYNTLEVTLPYSHEPFYVPNNLYIIGTMNTADRSIASVDIALRRRFRFIEMMPKPDLLKINDRELINVVKDGKKQYEINLKKLLETLNNRISYILDEDHQIGQSYFLKLLQRKGEAISEYELKDVFKYEILPLLNEYFYGDWEKIKAVLVKDSENSENLIEGSFIEEKEAQTLSCYCGDKKQCRFKKEFNIKEAIECIADDIIQ